LLFAVRIMTVFPTASTDLPEHAVGKMELDLVPSLKKS
jgi:hypothetical protein